MNIGSLLTQTALAFPERAAIVCGETQSSYAEYNARCNRLANALGSLGLRPGDHVGLLMYNCPEMLEAMFACFKAGFGAVPINFRLHPKEFAFIIDHSEARAVIVSPEFDASIAEIRDRIPKVAHIITVSPKPPGELQAYDDLLTGASDQFTDVNRSPDDIAWIFYTSGTTGQSKGAMLTHRNLMAMTWTFFADMVENFGTDEVDLHAAPLSHGSGLYALPNIARAATNIISDKSFDAEKILQIIETRQVTNFFAAPTMIKRLLDCPAFERYDLSSLKALMYGGAPMLVDDLKNAMEKLGPCLVQLYGQGESPMTITYLSHEDHILDGTPEQMKRLGSAGYARTGVEVAVVDAHDTPLPPGQMGEIVTRSDLVMKGYWNNPQATEETLRNGWLHTGDVGYLDERGYLFLMDRSKDMIISGGENIYPREIEEAIIQHPAVREVAVIGIPDAEWGEAIKAVVALVPGGSATEEELIAFCKEQIASYKKPKSIDFIDELPKNNYGKIVKRELRDRYWSDRRRQV